MNRKLYETVICTVFEGDYDSGVLALTNSLVCAGYKGQIYVCYRGAPSQKNRYSSKKIL